MRIHTENIPVTCEPDVAVARLAASEAAARLGFGTVARYSVVTSTSELATNLLVHGGGGTVEISQAMRSDGCLGLQVVARDTGPGIQDVSLALQDGYSTVGSLGGGLPGVGRLMSELQISSELGRGTEVRASLWADTEPWFRRQRAVAAEVSLPSPLQAE